MKLPIRFPRHRQKPLRGFTLIELLIVIGILAVLASIIFSRVGGVLKKAYDARARSELAQIAGATNQYVIDQDGVWPDDVDRGIPPGIEAYLGPGIWPQAPWPGSVYDYDAFTGSDGLPVHQISIRFCPAGQPAQCRFPDEPWAENFDYHSSAYFCIRGKCKAHPERPDDHPGFCINC